MVRGCELVTGPGDATDVGVMFVDAKQHEIEPEEEGRWKAFVMSSCACEARWAS
jgi:hypothetical protein